jgi:spermidine synthase
MPPRLPFLPILHAVFVLSGFSALIYQSGWTHYLGLVLGHAAYAQTLVLSMFMGGMALGAWWVSRTTGRLQRLLLTYALAECIVGVLGLAFHSSFVAYSRWSLDTVLPKIDSLVLASLWQWGSAALMIAPQTVLLGATFPLVAGAVLRAIPGGEARALGSLYFFNSAGAAVGVLCATFVLLPLWGKPGTLYVAGALNLLLACVAAWLSVAIGEQGWSRKQTGVETALEETHSLKRLARTLMLATFLSSAASFAYEIGWVRMLNQALGTTLHGFELMLAAFIAGMALGGLWIRRRAESITDVVRYAGLVQVAMGCAALISVPVLANSYGWVAWLHGALAPSDAGYLLYTLATAVIAILVMVPAAFFAGMTLPLFTAALLRRGAKEAVIGQVYAANTVGAIAGVLIMVHILMPLMGVSLAVVTAAMVDTVIGLVLLRGVSPGRWTVMVGTCTAASMMIFASVVRFGLPSAAHQASGVFRHGQLSEASKIIYYKDGPTASISVRDQGENWVISTNGKPDAGLSSFESEPSSDEVTMLMLGALPLALHKAPERVALIGWGSGLSTHTVLGSPLPKQVDTIEIEPAMWEGAKLFFGRSDRAYTDPRSRLLIDDARRVFASRGEPYDVIISEPSNPWVSGVSGLFTKEFYKLAKRRLRDDGLLVQWIHLYEMSDPLLAQMVAALLTEFPDAEFYLTNFADLIVVGAKGQLPKLHDHPWQQPELAKELRRVGLNGLGDLRVRRLGGAAALRVFVEHQRAKPHSDYFPTVALEAPRQRFRRNQALLLSQLVTSGLPVLNVLECATPLARGEATEPTYYGQLARQREDGLVAALAIAEGSSVKELFRRNSTMAETVSMLQAMRRSPEAFDPVAMREQLGVLAWLVLGLVDAEVQAKLWDLAAWQRDIPALTAAHLSQLRLYEATTKKRWREVQREAAWLLGAEGGNASAALREQYMMLGMLASMASGDPGAFKHWQERWDKVVPPTRLRDVREYLLAWQAAGEAVCAAQQRTAPTY